MMDVSSADNVIDLGRVIDERAISGFQIRVFLLCGLVGILDGLNSQSIGVAAKSMAADFHISMASFGPVFAAMLLGASIGAVVFGPMGDRFGRKPPMVLAMIIMAVFTLLTPAVHSVIGLIAVRFLLGVGLGGATPCFLALGAEYAPERLRQRISALLWLGFPIGVTFGSFFNAWLIIHYHWPMLFYVGGGAPVVLLLLIVAGLPESVRFLIARDRSPAAITAILHRLAPEVPIAPGTKFIAPHERLEEGGSETLLPGPSLVVTFALWLSFLTIFAALSVTTLWGPALLEQAGLPAGHAAIAVGLFGAGALAGILVTGLLLERYGKISLILSLILGAVSTAALGAAGGLIGTVNILMAIAGFFLGLGSAGDIALAAQLYPTASRSRGLGWAMGAGRFGQFLAPLLIGLLEFKLLPLWSDFAAIAAMPFVGALFMLAIRGNAEKK